MTLRELSYNRKIAFLDMAIKIYEKTSESRFVDLTHAICIVLSKRFLKFDINDWKNNPNLHGIGGYPGLTELKFPELYAEIQKSFEKLGCMTFLEWESPNYNIQGRLRLVKKVRRNLVK